MPASGPAVQYTLVALFWLSALTVVVFYAPEMPYDRGASSLRGDRFSYCWTFGYGLIFLIAATNGLLTLFTQIFHSPRAEAGRVLLWGATNVCNVSPIQIAPHADAKEEADLPTADRIKWNLVVIALIVYNTTHLLFVVVHRVYISSMRFEDLLLCLLLSQPSIVLFVNLTMWLKTIRVKVKLNRPRLELL